MTYLQNSTNMGGAISPVNAPEASQCIFWAPTEIEVPSSMAATGKIEVNGGHRTMSTPPTLFKPSNSSYTRIRASATVLNIFQLPATSGRRINTSVENRDYIKRKM